MVEATRYRTDQLIGDGVLTIGDGYRAKNSELTKHGLPFARAGNINDGFQFDGADCYPLETLARVGNKVSIPGDVVFTSKGTVGRFAQVSDHTPRFVYSPQLCFWRSHDKESLDPRYLYYWMQGPDFYAQFKGVSGQTDMAEYVSLTDQRRMWISLPPIGVQRRVSALLAVLDDKIELNRRMNETLEAQARALFRDWFVDFGPVTAKMAGAAPYLAPDLWSLFPDFLDGDGVPQGWRITPLDEVADFLNGLALQKFPPVAGEPSLPVVKIADLRTGPTKKSNRASTALPEKYVIDDGDFIFSWSGSLLAKFWTHGKGALNQHLFKVTSDQFPKWFYGQWVWHHMAEFQMIAASKATTMGHIQRGHLSAAMCLVPPAQLLAAMTEVMTPLLERTIANELENRTLAQTRDLLLPKLMSGEIRVRDVERKLELA